MPNAHRLDLEKQEIEALERLNAMMQHPDNITFSVTADEVRQFKESRMWATLRKALLERIITLRTVLEELDGEYVVERIAHTQGLIAGFRSATNLVDNLLVVLTTTDKK